MTTEPKVTHGGWRTCSRGHKYRGARCPICWPGGVSKLERGHKTATQRRVK